MTTQTHTNAGADRTITDITPRDLGKTIPLGADLSVADTDEPRPTLESTRTAIVDGYEATLDDELAPLELTARKDGEAFTDRLAHPAHPWPLGDPARGRSDLAHIRPNGEPGDGSTAPGVDVTFHTAAPGSGTYRLHLVSSTVTSSAPPPHPAHNQCLITETY
ncbi:hypothetical protein ACLMAL_38255 [Nocardia sp. CWNU-33]|uniref:hypothetical protein n=1 Tax=Nocardia sp. CWNU-33 TaxID=3392117 RepID=UPI00398E98B1